MGSIYLYRNYLNVQLYALDERYLAEAADTGKIGDGKSRIVRMLGDSRRAAMGSGWMDG